jgi:hypothetical protein
LAGDGLAIFDLHGLSSQYIAYLCLLVFFLLGYARTGTPIVPEKHAISVLLRNQLTYLSVHPPIDSLEDTVGIHPQRYSDEVSNSGGFSLIAHPDTKGIKMFHVKHYPFSH